MQSSELCAMADSAWADWEDAVRINPDAEFNVATILCERVMKRGGTFEDADNAINIMFAKNCGKQFAPKAMRDDPNEMTRDCLFVLQTWSEEHHWELEGGFAVWFTRKEAETYAESRAHHYGIKGQHWRAYGVCANGALATIVAQHTRPAV